MEASRSKRSEAMVEQSANERSQGAPGSNMDLDINKKMDWKLNKDDLCGMLKVNSIRCIERMRISPKELSQFDISQCRMVYVQLVRPTLNFDIKRFKEELTHGCHTSVNFFYVFQCNERWEVVVMTDEE
jgi:hypothetical protein